MLCHYCPGQIVVFPNIAISDFFLPFSFFFGHCKLLCGKLACKSIVVNKN